MTKLQLRPFQREDVQRIEGFDGRALVASAMGSGKTCIALSYLAQSQAWPALVVCPASVKYVWEFEALKWINLRPAILESQSPPDEPAQLRRNELLVINYDILRFWADWLKQQDIKTIVLDECTAVSNRQAKRSKAARSLCRSAENVIAMSGTPLTNRPSELWHVLHLVRPDLYPAFMIFAQKHCQPKKKPWGWEYKGASRIDELRTNLKQQLMIRRRKSEVLKELPEKTRQVVPLEMARPQEYALARDRFRDWLNQQGPGRLASAEQAERLVQLGELKRLAARLKLRYVLQWMRDFFEQTDEKLIVFACHRKMIEAIERRCDQKSVRVDGSVTGRKRKLACDQFQRDPKTRLFLGNIRAAGQGLTLTAASHVAFAELDWTPGMHSQAEDRAHRIGQGRPTWAHYLIAKGTIEMDLCETIQRKQRVLSKVLDGGTQEEDLNVFDLLCEKLKR